MQCSIMTAMQPLQQLHDSMDAVARGEGNVTVLGQVAKLFADLHADEICHRVLCVMCMPAACSLSQSLLGIAGWLASAVIKQKAA